MTKHFYMPDPQYVLNQCTRSLNRRNADARHKFAKSADGIASGSICEAWRFPIVDSYGGGAEAVVDPSLYSDYNQVTFIYADPLDSASEHVGIIGTFHNLYEPVPLARIPFGGEPTSYWAISFAVRKREAHRYRFFVDGIWLNDPINPLSITLPNGRTWSRFFTDTCAENLVLEDWEQAILQRLASQIAPLRTSDGERLLAQYYWHLDNANEKIPRSYCKSGSVGEIGFIDNILAREEHHRLVDYKICLALINVVLRQRDPYQEPTDMPDTIFESLYNEMASDYVYGWDTSLYASPLFFLNILRRHVCTGVFSHPKYGGNSAGASWVYLENRYRGADGTPLFKWRDGVEAPLGHNRDYIG